VELPQMQVGRVVFKRSPANRRDALEMAVDEHGFRIRIVGAIIVRQASEHRTQCRPGGCRIGRWLGPRACRGRSRVMKLESTNTLPWFASVLRIHMYGPID